jgi:hypothetical protein
MIALMAITPELQRRHFARFAGLKRCVLEHDPRTIKPISRHARPRQVREAKRLAAMVQRGQRADHEMQQLMISITTSCEVMQRLTSVMRAAEAVFASRRLTGDGETVVDGDLLNLLAALATEAGAAAVEARAKLVPA